MKHELADGEALVISPFGLCDLMRTVESRGTELVGCNQDTLFKGR